MRRAVLVIGICVSIAAVLVFYKGASATDVVKIRWLLPHGPKELFAAAESRFAERLISESEGTMTFVGTVLPREIGLKKGEHQRMQALDDGLVQMTSDFAQHLGQYYEAFDIVSLPFLFESYDEAEAFFASERSDELLEAIAQNTPYRALGFTMSGGMRIVASTNEPVRIPTDLKSRRVAVSFGGALSNAIIRAFGAEPVVVPVLEEDAGSIADYDIDAFETTYNRIPRFLESDPTLITSVTETNHVLALTVVIVKRDFFESLTAEQQALLKSAVKEAAALERADTIRSESRAKQALLESGATIITLSASERDAFKIALQDVRTSFADTHGERLMGYFKK